MGNFILLLNQKVMRIINGIVSVVMGILSVYLFLTAEVDHDIVIGVLVLLGGFIFLCFMIMDEQKEEIEKLRNIINRKSY
jgi:arginine exporter protein ArgO